jgi:hypothetical protein
LSAKALSNPLLYFFSIRRTKKQNTMSDAETGITVWLDQLQSSINLTTSPLTHDCDLYYEAVALQRELVLVSDELSEEVNDCLAQRLELILECFSGVATMESRTKVLQDDVKLYICIESGWKTQDIADYFKIHRSTVWRWKQRLGLENRGLDDQQLEEQMMSLITATDGTCGAHSLKGICVLKF